MIVIIITTITSIMITIMIIITITSMVIMITHLYQEPLAGEQAPASGRRPHHRRGAFHFMLLLLLS